MKIVSILISTTLVTITLALYPGVVAAGSVWRGEVSNYQEPVSTEEGTWWSYLTRWLPSRVGGYRPPVGTTFTVNSSAYASSPYQTDSTPCITAAGTRVRPGVVATNFLPLGTILKINGELYIVEDRMNPRFNGRYIDIWFPATSEALEFGRQTLHVEVIGYGTPGQDVRPEQTSNSEAAADAAKPGFLKRTSLQFVAMVRGLSEYLPTNVNRYDVDCFKSDIDQETENTPTG